LCRQPFSHAALVIFEAAFNLDNFVLSQFHVPSAFAKSALVKTVRDVVVSVFGVRAVANVMQHVVAPVTVKVARYFATRPWAVKSQKNQMVNQLRAVD
jgi:hypothetical protein